ncbi:uncharacterized protein [Macrobrachium rosenbergii]|uniref:uncharacterized protein isoform X2 n=1 Tax=Macrobrachium rosenbergii TaxID=79674 RepID=UPI0034D55EFF
MELDNVDLSAVLWHSVLQADIPKLKAVLLNGVDVDSFLSEDGYTALNLSSVLPEDDCFSVCQVLLGHGANPNIQNKAGESSVHSAASRGFCQVLDLLLINGGDPLLGDLRGRTPIDLAHKNGQTEAVDLLNWVLDAENYEVPGNRASKVVVSLLKEEAVEILCDSNDEESTTLEETCSPDLVSEKCSEKSNSSKWKRATCDNEKLQESCSDFSLLSMSRLLNSFCLEADESSLKLSNVDIDFRGKYFELLKRRLESNTDSDNESDMAALQTYLRKSLFAANDSAKPEDCSGYSDSVFELTKEFNFDESYAIQKDKKSAEQKPLGNAYQNSFLKRDINDNYTRDCTGVQHEKSAYISFDQSSVFLYESQSEMMSDTQYSLPSFAADFDTTAPLNMTKPEFCTSLQLLKAPRKAKSEGTYRKLTDVDYDAEVSCQGSHQDIKREFEAKAGAVATNGHYGNSYIGDSYIGEHCKMAERSVQKGNASVGGYGSGRLCESMGSTVKSFVGVMKEYLYEDLEEGVSFIERRCPVSESSDSFRTTNSTISSGVHLTSKQGQQKHNEVKPEVGKADISSTLGTLTDSVKNLRGERLVKSLKEIGYAPGPILPNTERLYQRHLMRLRKNPGLITQDRDKGVPVYSHELKKALEAPSSLSLATSNYLEQAMSSPFRQIDPCRHWRDGTNKTCFNYLLLDPRMTQNLPVRGALMGEEERFKCFISSIFYIGKGTRCRPYHHLYEAFKSNKKEGKKSKKVHRIQDIWSEGLGVVSLHVFQNTIPVEAWTREAAMISALGLQNICNDIRGTFYGVASTWKLGEQRSLGTYLLYRSLNIFMLEGERQLSPSDISVPSWKRRLVPALTLPVMKVC